MVLLTVSPVLDVTSLWLSCSCQCVLLNPFPFSTQSLRATRFSKWKLSSAKNVLDNAVHTLVNVRGRRKDRATFTFSLENHVTKPWSYAGPSKSTPPTLGEKTFRGVSGAQWKCCVFFKHKIHFNSSFNAFALYYILKLKSHWLKSIKKQNFSHSAGIPECVSRLGSAELRWPITLLIFA